MPLHQCHYHQLPKGELLLMQGSEVYIDPDILTSEALISWATKYSVGTTTERLALAEVILKGGRESTKDSNFVDLMSKLKLQREQHCYRTFDGLSDPASRMHDLLLTFRNESTSDQQLYFDAIDLSFHATSDSRDYKKVLAKDMLSLNKLIRWFKEYRNLIIRFSPFPLDELDEHEGPKTDPAKDTSEV
jgi:hypothetical protein